MRGLRRGVLVAALVSSAAALPAQVVNPGFETNGGAGTSTFAGWTVVDQPGSGGSWFVQAGTMTPMTGFVVPPPTEGTFAAMTDQVSPTSTILYQDIIVPGSGGVLSFDLFLNNVNGAYFTPPTLDVTFPGDNQQFRMDIMNTSAPLTDVGSGVLLNVYQTKVGDPPVSGYGIVTANLSMFAGQTVRLRFAVVDNDEVLNAGIDNLQFGSAVPTLSPAMLIAFGVVLAGAAAWRLRLT